MKKYITLAFSLLACLVLNAQEKAEQTTQTIEIKINGEGLDSNMMIKLTLLIVWSIIIIILVFRTFRNKHDV